MASTATAAVGTSSNNNNKAHAADTKIRQDLETLQEKMELCHAMLNPGAGDPSPSLKTSEAMLAVVGFLEACAPRMVELVEAAAQGALSEDMFAVCLEVNDKLQKQLADVETQAMTETGASTTAASASSDSNTNDQGSSGGVVETQFSDLLLDDSSGLGEDVKVPAVAAAGSKSTGEEDDEQQQQGDDDEQQQPSGVEQSKSADEFDDFFAGRTSSGPS
jgi:hypothetical protein